MEASARRVRAQRNRRRLPRRLRSVSRRRLRRLAGLLATAAVLTAGFATARLLLDQLGRSGDGGDHRAAGWQPLDGGTTTTLRRAVKVLRRQGYAPVRRADYRPHATLRVLVGRPVGKPDGPRRAFFFARGRLVGHDAPTPSAGLRVAAAGRRMVVLAYRTTRGRAPVRVRFRWSTGRLRALDRVPAPAARLAR